MPGSRLAAKIEDGMKKKKYEEDDDDDDSTALLDLACQHSWQQAKNDDATCDISPIKMKVWDENGKYKGTLDKVLPDTGAGANLMGVEESKQIGSIKNDLSGTVLTAANGLPISTVGTMWVTMEYGKIKKDVHFIITDEYEGTLLNRQSCKNFGLLPEKWPHVSTQIAEVKHQNPSEVHSRVAPKVFLGADHKTDDYDVSSKEFREQILEEFADVFDGDKPLEPMEVPPMVIKLKPDAAPVQITKPRPIPLPMRKEAKELLDDLERRGIIRKVTEPREWTHGMTLVRKKSGKLRLCVDLRNLNKHVKRPHFPISAPKDTISRIPPTAK